MIGEANGRHPTEMLAEMINKFSRDVEALQKTLPITMQVMGRIRKDKLKAIGDYIRNYGTLSETDDSGSLYNFEGEHAGPALELKRQYDNFNAAFLLIPRQHIISLVSQYDSFLGEIIRFFFAVNPEALDASKKSIPYEDLINFSKISDAQEFIIEKEVETVIRKSHSDQFDWLENKLGTQFTKGLACWPLFIELTERRNLFVHCDGRVSSQYLRVCSQHKYEASSECAVGNILGVGNEYFQSAYECIHEIGFKLAHVIWRRLCKEKIAESDRNINDLSFNLIANEEYNLAISILEFFSQEKMKHSEEACRRMMIINLAQAYKWQGEAGKCKTIVNSVDWSGWEDKYTVCVSVLKDDYEEAYRIVRCLKHSQDFLRAYYRQWPIFKELRDEEEFKELYFECYGEVFMVEESQPMQIESEAE